VAWIMIASVKLITRRFQGVRRHFGAVGKDVAAGLMLRHDHGPNYMSDDSQSEIAFLGIEASPSFVRQPEGNGSPSASSGR
jgi:putative transposase